MLPIPTTYRYTASAQQVLFGAGALEALSTALDGYGWHRLLLCTSSSQVRNGTFEATVRVLGERTAAVFPSVLPHVQAAQVEEAFIKYSGNQKLTVALLIGGVSFGDQEMKLDRGVDVLIATPGRLMDHFERGKLLLTGIDMLVIDEADRMLDMGFIPDIEKICKLLPFTRQTLFFSATMPPEIQRLTSQFLSNPVRVEVSNRSSTAETITHRNAISMRNFQPKLMNWS